MRVRPQRNSRWTTPNCRRPPANACEVTRVCRPKAFVDEVQVHDDLQYGEYGDMMGVVDRLLRRFRERRQFTDHECYIPAGSMDQ